MPEMKKNIPTRLAELEVLFVSAVRQPATGERFIAFKSLQANNFQKWIESLRTNKPGIVPLMDGMLASKKYDELRAMVKSEGGDVAQLDARLALIGKEVNAMKNWQDLEPTEKELAEMPGMTPVDLLDLIAYKREWTAEERQKHKEGGGTFAGEGESFPLKNCTDVHAAYMSANRAKGESPDAVRKKVMSFAKEHDMMKCLPETAQSEMMSKSGVLNGLTDALVGTMGLVTVPKETVEAIKTLRALIDVIEKSITGKAPPDSQPVGQAQRLLDELISMAGRAPSTSAPGKIGTTMKEQPEVVLGSAFSGSADASNITQGNPWGSSADMSAIIAGSPATKSLKKIAANLK